MPTILIAGGTGLVGQRLSRLLRKKNYEVLHLSRRQNLSAEFPAYAWDPAAGTLDETALERADYIVNLAGSSVAEGRWTTARKRRIIESRVNGALLFKKFMAKKSPPLRAYLSASASGYYGNRDDDWLSETDPPGEGFLPESVIAWEKAIGEVAQTGVRTVAFRIGIVLSSQGGALEKMLLPFHFFAGVYFGDGQQFYPWIHIDDLCRMFIEGIENERFSGAYNASAPQPASNRDLVAAAKEALGKPALLLPAPAFALRLAMGEMADMLLHGARVSSEKIGKAGFGWQFPELVPALKDVLRRKI